MRNRIAQPTPADITMRDMAVNKPCVSISK